MSGFRCMSGGCACKTCYFQEIDNDDEIWRGRVADDFLCTKSAVRECFFLLSVWPAAVIACNVRAGSEGTRPYVER